MKRFIWFCILACFLSSCQVFYYGYLPGTRYKILKPMGEIDLKGRTYAIEFRDNRMGNYKIDCANVALDRGTELEGDLGMQLLRESVTAMIENSNGKIDPASPNQVVVELKGLSFSLVGFGFIVPHGYVQFDAASPSLNKTYCSDMTDRDPDSPIHWYTWGTRRTASRLIVSGSLRRAVESFVRDLADQPL